MFIVYTVIVWMSVILSAFIDNIPYTATMLTVIPVIAVNLGIDPKLCTTVCSAARPSAAT